jgi:hypothetical protein
MIGVNTANTTKILARKAVLYKVRQMQVYISRTYQRLIKNKSTRTLKKMASFLPTPRLICKNLLPFGHIGPTEYIYCGLLMCYVSHKKCKTHKEQESKLRAKFE